jgi:phage tail-like protein
MRADRIARFLPETYRAANQPGSLLASLLGAMEALQQPSEAILGDVDRYVDPARAPDEFVPMLASWLDLTAYLDWSGGRAGAGAPRFAPGPLRLRLLVSRAAEFNARRGSRAALEDFLACATGCAGFTVEENPPDDSGRPRPFHIRVHAPAEAAPYADLVGRIVEGERPVYVTWEIVSASDADTAPAGAAKAQTHA